MSHDKECNPMTKNNSAHAQVTECDLATGEEINSLQQHHNIDNSNK